VGGHALTCRGRGAAGVLLAALVLAGEGCAPRGYRDHFVPRLASPSDHGTDVADDRPTPLREEHTLLLPGGLRIIRADVARPAPPFRFVDDAGAAHSPESLHGRVVWVDLWAVWCATCRAEFPFVQTLHERFSGNGLTVLAVCRNSSAEGFAGAARKPWIDFPVVDASALDDFPFPYRAFPTSVLIDRAGRIRAYWQGHRPPAAIEDAVRTLLAEDVPPEATVPAPEAPDPFVAAIPVDVIGSDTVVRAELALERDALPAGGYFEGTVTLDVDPGWHLNADPGEGFVPVELRFDSDRGFQSLGHHLPPARPVETAAGPHVGHTGVVELPVWGLLDAGLSAGQSVPLTIVATVQACDRTRCLPPAEIVLARHLWIEEPSP